MWAIEDKTAVVVVAPYHNVSRNPVRFKVLVTTYNSTDKSNYSFTAIEHGFDFSQLKSYLFIFMKDFLKKTKGNLSQTIS